MGPDLLLIPIALLPMSACTDADRLWELLLLLLLLIIIIIIITVVSKLGKSRDRHLCRVSRDVFTHAELQLDVR